MKLTPTSFALLTLLARRSMSAYELNKVMQNSVLRAFWPRAESHVYSEPKKLAGAGLVTCTGEKGRGKGRTVYHITDAGRRALRDWLAETTESYASQQFEGMVKFVCADSGDVAAMRRNLLDMRQRALLDARAVEQGIEQGRAYLAEAEASGMPFNAMAINYLIDLIELRLRWVDQTLARLDGMRDTADSPANRKLGEASYAGALTRLERILADPAAPGG